MIYLIQAGATNWYKLGYTERSASKRCAELQTGNPETLHIVQTWPGTQAQEKEMHKALEAWSAPGGSEWFILEAIELRYHLHRRGVKVDADASVKDLLPLLTLPAQDLGPIPRSESEVKDHIIRCIQDYYLEFGPREDGGHIEVGDGIRELLLAGIWWGDLWCWYTWEDFQSQWSLSLEEAYGVTSVGGVLLEDGIIEREGSVWRVVPTLEDAGFVWEILYDRG